MIINTGFKILKSRFKKESDFAKERMKICDVCEYNTKNMQRISLKQKTFNFFSNLVTLLTKGKRNESDDSCNICGCTLSFKILEEGESCPAEPSKWKSIYIKNSAKKK
jgi:hypothetical protein